MSDGLEGVAGWGIYSSGVVKGFISTEKAIREKRPISSETFSFNSLSATSIELELPRTLTKET